MVIEQSGVQFNLLSYLLVINKIGQFQNGSPICQSQVWLQTELDDEKSCYQLIITITISQNHRYI